MAMERSAQEIDEAFDRQRANLLDAYGLYPTTARAYLETKLGATPEDIRQACPNGHGDHGTEALVRIALGDEEAYLLEEVYEQVREEVDARELAAQRAQGLSGWNPMPASVMMSYKRDSLRLESRDLRREFQTS